MIFDKILNNNISSKEQKQVRGIGYTKFNYPMEKNLIKKIDELAERCIQKNPKRDCVLNIEAPEGGGKTTLSIAIAYYLSEKMGRPFDHTHIFFDVNDMIDYLKEREGEIVIWDEPALQALSGDSATNIVKDLTRLLMMCRKKRHFIIINQTYFNKFNEYVVWQRPMGMIHLFERKTEKQTQQRFIYIKKKNLEKLWNDWKRKNQRNYFKYKSKFIQGTFPDILNPEYKHNILSEFNVGEYERRKDEAIAKIGEEKISKFALRLYALQFLCSKIPEKTKKIGEWLNVSQRTIEKWNKLLDEHPEIKPLLEKKENKRKNISDFTNENEDFEPNGETT